LICERIILAEEPEAAVSEDVKKEEGIFEGIYAVGQLFKPPALWQRYNRVRSMTRHDPTLD
jgi:hypothetical protein